MTAPLPSSPTPPDAPTPPDEYAELRKLVANQRAHDEALVKYPMTAPIIHKVTFNTSHADALASLLRAYEGMRADAERLDWLEGWRNAVLFEHANGWTDVSLMRNGQQVGRAISGQVVREERAQDGAPRRHTFAR